MAAVAAGAQAVGSVIGGISANEQAKADARIRKQEGLQDENITRSQFQAAAGTQIAQAGGTGLSLSGGSNLNIFTQSALNEAQTISDIRFATAVDAANLKQAGKNALIGGALGAVGAVTQGVSNARFKKRILAQQRAGVSSRAARRAAAPSGRSLLGPQ